MSRPDVLALQLQQEVLDAFGLLGLEHPDDGQDEERRDRGDPVDPDPRGQPDREARQHHARVLGIVDLRAVADEARGAHDTERARQARAHDQHHERADQGEDDLGLDHGGVARRRAPALGPERERRAERRGDREADGGLQQLGFLRHVTRGGLRLRDPSRVVRRLNGPGAGRDEAQRQQETGALHGVGHGCLSVISRTFCSKTLTQRSTLRLAGLAPSYSSKRAPSKRSRIWRGREARGGGEERSPGLRDRRFLERRAVEARRPDAHDAARGVLPDRGGLPALDVELALRLLPADVAERRAHVLHVGERRVAAAVGHARAVVEADQALVVGAVVPVVEEHRQQPQRVALGARGGARAGARRARPSPSPTSRRL